MLKVTINVWEIVGGVVRYRDLVGKIKLAKFFPGVFVGDLRKFVLAKISRYMVCWLPSELGTCTNSVYQVLFPPSPRESLGTMLV